MVVSKEEVNHHAIKCIAPSSQCTEGIQIHPDFPRPGPQFPLAFADPTRWEQVFRLLSSALVMLISYQQGLNDVARRATWTDRHGKTHKPSIVIVILPQSAAQLKKQIKYWSTVRANISTQCVVRVPSVGLYLNPLIDSFVIAVGKK